MGKGDAYNDLVFQLGDLARERLPGKPSCPPSMQRVLRAEEALLARQDELAALEQQMNDEDEAWQQYQAALVEERAGQQAVTRRFRKAVDAIEGRVKELRKKLGIRRADHRYSGSSLKKEERKLADLEMTLDDPRKLSAARDNMKRMRLTHLRMAREIEELSAELEQSLTPRPGQPGAEGILAHKRLLELEDEEQERKAELDELMSELDQAVAQKELEGTAAEDYLDQALFLLGEECYAQRLADPALAALYPRIDRAR